MSEISNLSQIRNVSFSSGMCKIREFRRSYNLKEFRRAYGLKYALVISFLLAIQFAWSTMNILNFFYLERYGLSGGVLEFAIGIFTQLVLFVIVFTIFYRWPPSLRKLQQIVVSSVLASVVQFAGVLVSLHLDIIGQWQTWSHNFAFYCLYFLFIHLVRNRSQISIRR